MALKSGAEYIERMRKMQFNAYYRGEKIENVVDHPVCAGVINEIAGFYDMTLDPKYEDLMTETSHLTGEKISGFTHMPRSRKDLLKELDKTRFFVSKAFGCTPRCNSLGLLIPMWVVTYNMEHKLGTNYHQRFKEFMRKVQEDDLVCTTTVSDVKGDRSKRRKEQVHPDYYVRVVEKKKDGIIVRGAKAHASFTVHSDFCMVAPAGRVREDESEYAICCAIPGDTKGVTFIVQDCVNQAKRFTNGGVDFGLGDIGQCGGVMILDDVFVPSEHVFMCGEAEFTPELVEAFGTYHRNVPAACRAGQVDVLLGAAQCIAEYNGVAKTSHIRDKITKMGMIAESAFASSLGAAWKAHETPSGIFHPDVLLANVARICSVTGALEAEHLLTDIAGGLMFTMPSEKDLKHPVLGQYINKYLGGIDGVSVEDRMRIFRLIQIMTVEGRVHSMICAGGTPQTHNVFIYRKLDLEGKKKLAKDIAGIKE